MCQSSSKEKLSCPATYEKTAQGKSRSYVVAEEYQQIEQSILTLSQLNELPDSINVNALDEGGIAKTLINHGAKLHRSWRQKIKSVRVSQAEDRAGNLLFHSPTQEKS